MQQQYLYALAPGSEAQTIPPGFGGHGDWDDIDDDARARRGWVRPSPPPLVAGFELAVPSFVQGADGLWAVSYEVVPAPLEVALAAAYAAVAAKRFAVEVAGLRFGEMTIPTDREVTQPRVEGAAAKAKADPDFQVVDWKLGPGVFVTLDNATLIALGEAMTAHVQGCFSREATISKLLSSKKKAETIRTTLDAELNRGWPV